MNKLWVYIIIFFGLFILTSFSIYSIKALFRFTKDKINNFFINIFYYRYLICITIGILIVILGFYLYLGREWNFKDVAQVCTGFFILITLFFAALNFEFAANKTKNDVISARNTLTYNTANEWHKSPMKDFERIVIEYEKKFIATKDIRDITDFETFIENQENALYVEAFKGILNQLESISIGASKGLLDKAFMHEFYRGIFKIYYIDYWYYINHRRSAINNKKVWLYFTNLAEEWIPDINKDLLSGVHKSTIINKT